MSRPMWVVKVIKAGFPHTSLMARMTRVPGIGRVLERILFEGDELLILPRDDVVSIGEDLDTGSQVVLPSLVVEHFIQRAGHLFVMNKCICRDSMHCTNHPQDIGCLFMGDAVLGINPELGREVTRSEALEHLAKAREAGLFHLVGRNRMDTVWLGVGPGGKLLTVCNCCTCCCIWRMLPLVAERVSSNVSRMPGVSVEVTGDCDGCGKCASICFTGAATVEDGRSSIGSSCRGCGRCAEACPRDAIEVMVDEEDFIEQAVRRIAPAVDIG